MSKELIERLRADAESTDDIGLCADAANRIEELERKNKRLFNEHHYQACLTHALLPYQERAVKAEQQLAATIDILEQTRVERDALQADNAEIVSLTNQRDYEYVRAENAEQERDQLRDQIKMLRDVVGHVAGMRFSIVTTKMCEATLAATETKE